MPVPWCPLCLWQRLTFVGRLLVIASITLLVAGLIMVLVSARQEAHDVRSDLRAVLDRELETLPATLAEMVVIGDFTTLQQTLDHYVARPLVVMARFHDTTGTVLESRDRQTGEGAPGWFMAAFAYTPIEDSAPVVVGGRAYGELTLRLNPHEPARRAWTRLLNHLAILWLAIAIDFIGIWLVLRFGLRPLRTLSDAADALAAGKLDVRLPAAGSPEMQHLMTRFNEMAASLQDSHETLRASEERYRESESLLRTAIDAIDEAFVIFDPDDRLVYCNEKYRAAYPLVADLIEPGRTFTEIVRTWKERGGGDPAPQGIEAWLAERVAHHRSGSVLVQRTESDHWLRIVERRTAEGYIVGFRVDITELVHAKQQADAASLAKSRFLAAMSHEIRTPMNGILGMAQLLMVPGLAEDERIECARILHDSGKALMALLNDILDFSKIEAGRMVLHPADFAPEQLLQEIVALYGETALGKGLTLAARWHGGAEARYRGDALRLRQMLTNLVDNAIKFTHAGRVDVEAREESCNPGWVQLHFVVRDTGIGIPADKQALLFQPFTQLDASSTRAYGGTGLGLSIVRNLAQLMGGQVGVDSSPGAGSSFWFRVRLQKLAENAPEGETLIRGERES